MRRLRGIRLRSRHASGQQRVLCIDRRHRSKLIAYGNNRADYTFIPGGMIPGVVIIEPDYPELKDAMAVPLVRE
jgi:hypothetical protein